MSTLDRDDALGVAAPEEDSHEEGSPEEHDERTYPDGLLDGVAVSEQGVLLGRAHGFGLMVMGALGLAAALSLAIDKYKILEDPSFEPSCNINPVLSCGSVMVTDQAEAFGFPNPVLGIGAFTVVIMLGALVASRVVVPRWMVAAQALGSVLGLVFVHWLAFQSLYRIGALCPWCMVVWSVTIPLAVWSVLSAVRTLAPGRVSEAVWGTRYVVTIAWYAAFVVAILIRFWDYWSTLI